MKLVCKVIPNSKLDMIEIINISNTWLEINCKIKIKWKPIDWKANNYLIDYVAKIFWVERRLINIIKWQSSRYKVIYIDKDIQLWKL